MNSSLLRIWENRQVAALVGILMSLLQEAFGGLPVRALGTLSFFVVLDFLMGNGIAIWSKTWESQMIYRLPKKIGLYGCVLLVINLLAKSDPSWTSIGQSILTGCMGIMLTGEAVSLLEKLAEISKRTGVEMPVIGFILNRLKTKQGSA